MGPISTRPTRGSRLCVDENSQIQALDRPRPSLPMKRGLAGTRTHDSKRNGTTPLFAAFDLLDGTVISGCRASHGHEESLAFLSRLNRGYERDLDLHLIVDTYGTHTHPNVHAGLAKHQGFVLHITPTRSRWLNLVAR